MLLDIINSRMWPPTLRDLAAGHLGHLLETHHNLVVLGGEWEARCHGAAGQQADKAHTLLSVSTAGMATPLPQQLTGPNTPTSTGPCVSGVSRAATDTVADTSLPAAASVPTLLAGATSTAGSVAEKKADATSEATAAAGSHAGLVPVMSCLVNLMHSSHPLLELRGARGIARICYAGSLGAPSTSHLLGEAKASAAASGAIAALIKLLR
jgi:hypothetical protein